MSLVFKDVRWQNFLSTGNQWTSIKLNKSPSTLIVGENGAGKSTLLDAISFALYGKPYRNINKNQLINSITGKHCLVEIDLAANNKSYTIRRGIKPNLFEVICDGKLIDQNASVREYQEYLEKSILKLNHKSFTQIVVIGAANFTPFMQLKATERRAVIEDLLDIEIFSKMFAILKQKIQTNKAELGDCRYNVSLLEQRIEMTRKHLNEMQAVKHGDIESKKTRIVELTEEIEKLQQHDIADLNEQAKQLQQSIDDQPAMMQRLKKLDQFSFQLTHKIDLLNNDIAFLHDNSTCPTCTQEIDPAFKDDSVATKEAKKKEIDDGVKKLHGEYDAVNKRIEEIQQVQKKISEINTQLINLNASVTTKTNSIKELKQQIEQAQLDSNSDKYREELDSSTSQLKRERARLESLVNLQQQYDIASSLLKDGGIKTRIIKQYVPIINKLMNKYLAAMDFFVQFELDENFNEKIKSRFRDEFTYNSFSEGEKMRVDLALLFTWRAVAKLRNSATTNLLILDEVFDSSLDNTGTDEFTKMISQLNQDKNNTFIISHKGDQLFDRFHSNIRFEKVKNFSQIAK